MLRRTFFVILFFWAALTVITPILIRLSASVNVLDYDGEKKNDGSQSSKEVNLISRRALGSIKKDRPASTPSPSPSPSMELHRQTTFGLEESGDMITKDVLFSTERKD